MEKCNADVDCEDKVRYTINIQLIFPFQNSRTPLFFAGMAGRAEVIEYLLNSGARHLSPAEIMIIEVKKTAKTKKK